VLLQTQSCVYQIFHAYPAEVKAALPSLAKDMAVHMEKVLRAAEQTHPASRPVRPMLSL
jgi:hypothetical protein